MGKVSLRRDIELSHILLPHAAITRPPINREVITSRMNMIAPIEQQHLTGNDAYFHVTFKSIHNRRSPTRVHFRIVVQQRNIIATRRPNTRVTRAGETTIFRSPSGMSNGSFGRYG